MHIDEQFIQPSFTSSNDDLFWVGRQYYTILLYMWVDDDSGADSRIYRVASLVPAGDTHVGTLRALFL